MSFNYSGISQYHEQLMNGTVSCVEAVQHYLHEIARNQPLNAMLHVFEQEAMAQAMQLDAAISNGQPMLPLHGVVVTIKDVFNYKGHPVTAGSRMLENYRAVYSATAVQRLLDAGAIIIGTTNCDEFAMGSTNENCAHGVVRNAADPNRVPGGSSGGAAVSVQAGLCMIAIGSDTGGSVRQPADYCGVVGLKPSYGRISRYGLIAYASSFDCLGVLGLSVADVAKVYDVLAGPDGLDSTAMQQQPAVTAIQLAAPEKPLRFAWLQPTLGNGSPDAEIQTAIRNTFAQLQAQGHTVTAVPFDLMEFIVPTYYVLTTAEASSNLGRFDGIRYGHAAKGNANDLTAFYKQNRSEGFGAEVKRRIMLGTFVLSAGYYDAYFTKAQQVRAKIVADTALIFSEFDAILMPVSPTTAPLLGELNQDPVSMYMADIYTVFANLAGIPGLALPLYRHSNGLPFGLQVLCNRGEEVLLHRIGAYLEANMANK